MRILNFGSLNIDLVYTVEHFVQPGETISSLQFERFCGGKGANQSLALAGAGASVFHAGVIGPDGGILKERLQKSGVDVSLLREGEVPTGNAMIQIDSRGQNCIVLYGGANQTVDPAYADAVLENFQKDDVLLLQNEISCIDHLVEKAFSKGMKIAFNPSPINEAVFRVDLSKITWFILNEIEAGALTGEKEPGKMARELRRRYPDSRIVLTLGKEGSLYYDGGEILRQGIYEVPVADTTGAGDTFTGFFLASVCAGRSPAEALRRAAAASSLAVSVKGAANSIPTMRQVEAAGFF